jgi:putative addiction module component (TIGR02574 family)
MIKNKPLRHLSLREQIRLEFNYQRTLRKAMSMTLQEIEKEISALAVEDKTAILRHLIAELDGPADDGVDAAWRVEVQRRYQELKDGTVETVPVDKVITGARERLKNAC